MPGQPSKALLLAAQRKKHHVFFFSLSWLSRDTGTQHTCGERKGGPSVAGWGRSHVRHLDLGSLWPAARSCHPEHGRPEFSSSPGCLKTILARTFLAPVLSTQLRLGVRAVQALAIQTSACFCPQQTCHVRQGEQRDCAGRLPLTQQRWDEEAVYLRKLTALAGAVALSAMLAGLQDPLRTASGL